MLVSMIATSISGTRFLKITSAYFGSAITSRQPMYAASRNARNAFTLSPIVFSLAMMDIEYMSSPKSAQAS